MPAKRKTKRYRYPTRPLLESSSISKTQLSPTSATRLHDAYKYTASNMTHQGKAENLIKKRMTLLKTEKGRITYLQELLKFSKDRNSLVRNISRAVEASQRVGVSIGKLHFLLNLHEELKKVNSRL